MRPFGSTSCENCEYVKESRVEFDIFNQIIFQRFIQFENDEYLNVIFYRHEQKSPYDF